MIKSYSRHLKPFSVVKQSVLCETDCTLVSATVLLSAAVVMQKEYDALSTQRIFDLKKGSRLRLNW
jgi:hypothetical protein